jgi:hypothetical protein
MAGKYKVLIPFHRVDPKSGDVTEYNEGDTYAGPDADKYLADPNPYAPDHGPLIADVSVQAPAPVSQEK